MPQLAGMVRFATAARRLLAGIAPTGWALALLAALPATAAPAAALPGVERLVSLPTLSGTPPSQAAWSPDSRRLAFLWNDAGFLFRDVWVVEAGAAAPRQLTRLRPDLSRQAAFGEHLGDDLSLEALAAESARRHAVGVTDLAWSPDGSAIYLVYQGDILAVDVASGELRTVVAGLGAARLGFAPDGSHLAFLAGGDLWLYRFDGDFLLQATQVGTTGGGVAGGRFHAPDREFTRYAWSADSRYLALDYVDRRDVHRMQIPSYLHPEPIMQEVRRGYPGHEDLVRKVGVYDTRDGLVRFLALDEPRRRTVIDLAWSPVRNELLVQQDSYDGEHRWLFVAPATGGEPRQLHYDHRPRRIYSLFTAAWSSDGRRVLFVGDSDDYYRLYAVDRDGGKPRILTRGDFDVAGQGFGSAGLQVSAATGEVFFTSSEHGPAERQVYRMPEGGGRTTRVTRTPGTHGEASVSPDGRYLAVVSSSDTVPPELHVIDVPAGESWQVTHSPLPEFAGFDLVEPEYVTFPSRVDDFTLHARILKPANLDPSRKYPVIFGNVYSNTARNEWSWPRPISLLQQKMVADGYIVIQTDLRGSSGYGVAFREAFQGDWGGDDLEDMHSTVEYLATLPYVDTDRIGVWGNSYGGMMVLFALFERPGLFAAGVSGSPAIDVRYFTQNDQHLSRRPQSHPEIFRKSTLLNYGEKLEDPLLFIHGLHDDIVPWKTTAAMIEKLMLLGKDFSMIVPPQSAHWWAYPEHYAVHTFRELFQFFDRHLAPARDGRLPVR